MGMYLVTADTGSAAKTNKDAGNAMIVSAGSTTDAKAIAAAKYDGDSAWSDATATLLSEVAANAASALTDWTFEIIIFTATPKKFTLTCAGASQDTLDEVGAALATLINLDADIAGAAYNATTQVLTIAETTDGLGDMAVTVKVYPPTATYPGAEPITGFVSSITDEGAAGDALSCTFAADTFVVPRVFSVLKST